MNIRLDITEDMRKLQAAQEALVAAQTAQLEYMPVYVPPGDIALGLAADNIIPLRCDIPRAFLNKNNPWRIWTEKWFYHGLDNWPVAREGVDLQMALNNLTVCIRGRDIGLLHKMMGVAYLASIWFTSPAGPPISKENFPRLD
jgi:hypothetical protein